MNFKFLLAMLQTARIKSGSAVSLRNSVAFAAFICAVLPAFCQTSSSSIPTAQCQFTLFDVGTSGASFANRINRWHTVIGNSESVGNFARWPSGGVTKIVIPVNGDEPSIAERNYYGVMVGWFFDPNFIEHGFVFAKGVTTVFDYPGASGTELHGINK